MYRVQTMAVTVTQLAAFLAVVRHGSVTAAAEELVVTQPSVSAAVAALERELKVKLTERVGRNVRPTAAGEAYSRYAADILGLLDEGAQVAGEVDRGAGRQLDTASRPKVPMPSRPGSDDGCSSTPKTRCGNGPAISPTIGTRTAAGESSRARPGRPGRPGHRPGH
jgi:hypothetical protein